MKILNKIFFLTLCTPALLWAVATTDNEIKIDQAGDTLTLTIDQIGYGNKLCGTITSNNHGYPRGPGTMTYGPAPGGTENSPFQDMNGNDFGEGFANPLTGNYNGRYSVEGKTF